MLDDSVLNESINDKSVLDMTTQVIHEIRINQDWYLVIKIYGYLIFSVTIILND